jgi:hypothetical protein
VCVWERERKREREFCRNQYFFSRIEEAILGGQKQMRKEEKGKWNKRYWESILGNVSNMENNNLFFLFCLWVCVTHTHTHTQTKKIIMKVLILLIAFYLFWICFLLICFQFHPLIFGYIWLLYQTHSFKFFLFLLNPFLLIFL